MKMPTVAGIFIFISWEKISFSAVLSMKKIFYNPKAWSTLFTQACLYEYLV